MEEPGENLESLRTVGGLGNSGGKSWEHVSRPATSDAVLRTSQKGCGL